MREITLLDDVMRMNRIGPAVSLLGRQYCSFGGQKDEGTGRTGKQGHLQNEDMVTRSTWSYRNYEQGLQGACRKRRTIERRKSEKLNKKEKKRGKDKTSAS